MKFLTVLGLSIVVATPAFAVTDAVWSNARSDYVRAHVQSDPDFRNYVLADCKRHTATAEDPRKLSKKLHVPLSKAIATYCHRVIRAYASDKVSYDDYVKYQTEKIESPSISRALQGG
jgi:hypothetical protein